jgi:hypothetical protein
MAYGFKTLSAGGIDIFTTDDFSISILDVFEVSPTSSGSKVYPNTTNVNMFVVQSSIEPTTTDYNSLISFNSVATAITKVGSNTTLNWSPDKQTGQIQNVILYVLGN